MIPSLREVLDGYGFVRARRQGLGEPSREAIAAALEDAGACAAVDDPPDEPAAIFFAFARHPRAFPGGWRFMTALLALNQARSLRFRVHASAGELDDLCMRVVGRAMSFEEVRQWFASRLDPL